MNAGPKTEIRWNPGGRRAWFVCLTVLTLFVAGCNSVGYYAQSVRGQLDIWRRAEPIAEVLKDDRVPAETRQKLRLAVAARQYAVTELGLPDNDSYTEYAALNRPFVVWNIFAAPELSLEARKWCFPIVGCVTYRGYFQEAAAREYAGKLSAAGDDVYVGGVPAYSTLGWFDDPLLSSVLHYDDEDLVGLIFHELAHQVAFAKGDTVFNESFAATVERVGVERWLRDRGDPERIERYRTHRARSQQVIDLILENRNRLEALFQSDRTPAVKREHKARIIAGTKQAFLDLTRQWPGYDGFAQWFAQPINNAQLASVAAYNQWVPAFERLLFRHEGDLDEFYKTVKELAGRPRAERHGFMRSLL